MTSVLDDQIAWLQTEEGNQAMSIAVSESDALKASTRIRKTLPHVPVDYVSFIISQAKLSATAQARWGTNTAHFLFTDDGLAQATRPQVASYRAKRLREMGFTSGIDLTAGLGFDIFAFAQAGIYMQGVERDQHIAALAAHNLLGTTTAIHVADATSFPIPATCDFVFIDPARRDTDGPSNPDGSTKRQFNPNNWSPPWSFVESLASKYRVLVKAAPGMDVSALTDWDVEWVSIDGSLVEANLLSGGTGKRTATLLSKSSDEVRHFISTTQTPVKSSGTYLVIPDAAIIRAGAIDQVCALVSGGLVNEFIAWIISDDRNSIDHELNQTPRAIDALEILTEMRIDERDLREAISTYGASAITIMTRGVDTDVEDLRKRLLKATTKGTGEIVIALCRDEPQARAFVCRRLAKRG